MNFIIHNWVLNAMTAPTPTQYTNSGKYRVDNTNKKYKTSLYLISNMCCNVLLCLATFLCICGRLRWGRSHHPGRAHASNPKERGHHQVHKNQQKVRVSTELSIE